MIFSIALSSIFSNQLILQQLLHKSKQRNDKVDGSLGIKLEIDAV